MPRQRVPTMKDVAERAGVSIQTVSSIVNDRPGYTAEMRARVQRAIDELGYRPFAVARSLRTRETRTIALIVSDIANPSFATMASAAEDHAHRQGYSLVLYNTHDDVAREQSYIRAAAQRWIDGALFVSAEDRASSLDAFHAAGIPTVAIDRMPAGYTGPSVTLDNRRAGQLAAQHLLCLGHTRLAHISGPLRLSLSRERQAGFLEALAAARLTAGSANAGSATAGGVAPATCAGGEGHWGCEDGYATMQRLLAGRRQAGRPPAGQQPPTGVFAANDRMAIGALRALREAGLRVPEDVSVIGLDDIEVAAYQAPPLTTIRQSFTELATRALGLLLAIIQGHPPAQTQIRIEPELVIRQSTGAPGAGRAGAGVPGDPDPSGQAQ